MPKNGEWVDATTERFIYQVTLIMCTILLDLWAEACQLSILGCWRISCPRLNLSISYITHFLIGVMSGKSLIQCTSWLEYMYTQCTLHIMIGIFIQNATVSAFIFSGALEGFSFLHSQIQQSQICSGNGNVGF